MLDILVRSQHSAKAANRFFRKLLKGLQHLPRAIVTDKLRTHAAGKSKQHQPDRLRVALPPGRGRVAHRS